MAIIHGRRCLTWSLRMDFKCVFCHWIWIGSRRDRSLGIISAVRPLNLHRFFLAGLFLSLPIFVPDIQEP